MTGETPNLSPESSPKLLNCKQAIHNIVAHGEYMDGGNEQSTEFTLWLEDGLDNHVRINVYDSLRSSIGNHGPTYGASIFYTDAAGEARQDWFGFVGYDQEALASSDNEPRRAATDEDIAMFSALLDFVRGNLVEAAVPAKTWRDSARHLGPHFE